MTDSFEVVKSNLSTDVLHLCIINSAASVNFSVNCAIYTQCGKCFAFLTCCGKSENKKWKSLKDVFCGEIFEWIWAEVTFFLHVLKMRMFLFCYFCLNFFFLIHRLHVMIVLIIDMNRMIEMICKSWKVGWTGMKCGTISLEKYFLVHFFREKITCFFLPIESESFTRLLKIYNGRNPANYVLKMF